MIGTVLVVEDNPGDAKLAELTLRTAGTTEVLQAARLDEAEQVLTSATVDAVLLDLGLPDVVDELDGVRRLTDRFPDVPVVVLTGAEDTEVGTAAIAAGAQDYLPKADLTAGRLRACLRFARQRHDARRLLRHQAAAQQRLAASLQQLNLQVAHDTKNALTSIGGIADLLVERPEFLEEEPALLQRIRDRAHTATASLNAAMDVGLQRPAPASAVDLDRLVEEVVTDLDDDRLVVHVGDLPTVTTSGPIVRTVLDNLLRNAAIHAAPDREEPVVVEVTARRTVGAWLLSVADDGAGIAEDDRERALDLGQQIGGDDIGHGVGLNSVRSAVEGMGGVVWLERSRLGGLAVQFTLPDRT